jgi:hypothetical protein
MKKQNRKGYSRRLKEHKELVGVSPQDKPTEVLIEEMAMSKRKISMK